MPCEWIPQDYFQRADLKEITACDRSHFEIDLGCGDGSFLLAMAKQFPERQFLGVERLLGRVKKVGKKIQRAELNNARVLRLESNYTVECLIPLGTVQRLHLLCPDPWPKIRHHRRRLVQQAFLQHVYDVLTPTGEFLFMTDHEEYFEWAMDQLRTFQQFKLETWHEDDFFYPKTDFQIQWEAEGKSMHRVRCLKH